MFGHPSPDVLASITALFVAADRLELTVVDPRTGEEVTMYVRDVDEARAADIALGAFLKGKLSQGQDVKIQPDSLVLLLMIGDLTSVAEDYDENYDENYDGGAEAWRALSQFTPHFLCSAYDARFDLEKTQELLLALSGDRVRACDPLCTYETYHDVARAVAAAFYMRVHTVPAAA
jgi:hypothetical protein